MKYPPFSWLRLGEDIKHSPGRIWFTFDKIPDSGHSALAKVYIGSAEKNFSSNKDLFEEALEDQSLLLPQQKKGFKSIFKAQ